MVGAAAAGADNRFAAAKQASNVEELIVRPAALSRKGKDGVSRSHPSSYIKRRQTIIAMKSLGTASRKSSKGL